MNSEKKNEVLINYCGMPLFFARREFAIVSGLKCHLPSEPIPEFIVKKELWRQKKGEKEETRQSSKDFELTVKYLLKPLEPKTNNLFGFPWAFMVWAFEAIPYLRHQVTAEKEISSPRILRWLKEKTKTVKNPPDIYNPPHDAELQMPYLITLGLVETLFDHVVDIVKMELAGARTIKRDRFDNELVVFDGVDGTGIDAGVGGHIGVEDALAFSVRSARNKMKAVNEFKNKRGVKVIPSKNVQNPYTPHPKRRKKSFIKAIQNLKKKIFGELPMAVGEKLLELNGNDFRVMTDMNTWWENWNHGSQLLYQLQTNVDNISKEATRVGGKSFTQLLKEILAVMNLNNIHFVTLEILLHDGRLNVYDCNLTCMEHDEFFTFIQPLIDLLLILLRQSGIMKHLPDKLLNKPWKFEGRSEPMVKNLTGVACGSYSLAFIEHLITNTKIQPPNTLLCDNTVGRLQWNWVAGIVDRNLVP
ncbi:hypothetical protein H5410_035905 [Solanum commersonii]|uniref:Ubiquitin-like protease family profile domain-containing protein n=1 Tax=Solanum commersonii TaxID=4109 RepID=A0A9J5Y2L5_SOLCO|nr:hypothetical protein H5410_035905 [Solanum commersonii]